MGTIDAPEPLPERLRPRRGRIDPGPLVGLALVAFLALSLLKPWSWLGARGQARGTAASVVPEATEIARSPEALRGPGVVWPISGFTVIGPVRDSFLAELPVAFDTAAAQAQLSRQDGWAVATLVGDGAAALQGRPGAERPRITPRPGRIEPVSRTTLGLDPRADHGPWITRPPVLLWPAAGQRILLLALLPLPGQVPRDLRLWREDDTGALSGLELNTLATTTAGPLLLLPPSLATNVGPPPAEWPAGTYRLEFLVGAVPARLTIVILVGPPGTSHP